MKMKPLHMLSRKDLLSFLRCLVLLIAFAGPQLLYARQAVVTGTASSQTASAAISEDQEKPILAKGIVTDINGVPLPGVAVIVKNFSR